MGRWNRNASTVEANARAALAVAAKERAAAEAKAEEAKKTEHQDYLDALARSHAIQKAERAAAEAGAEETEEDSQVATKEIMLLSADEDESSEEEDEGADEAHDDLPSIDTSTAVKRELVDWLTEHHPAHGEDDPTVLMRSKKAHLVELVEGALASPHQTQ